MNSPSPPDPYQTANAQTQANVAAGTANQNINQINQTNPYGSLTYSQSGTNPDGTPKYNATTQLNGAQQGLLDQQNANKAGAGNIASQYLSGGQGALSGKGPDLSYNGTTAALDSLNHARLDPQWAQNSQHEADTLAAQGVVPGTGAYDNAMRVFNQGKNDAYNSANLADYQTSSNNALNQWQAPMGAYSSLMGQSSPTNFNPMSTPTTNIPATNVAGLIQQNYQQQSTNANAQNGQLAGLVGTGLGLAAAPFTGGTSLAALGGTMGGLFGSGSSGAGMGNFGQYSPYSPMNAGQ